MSKTASLITGAALGSLAMYLMDPNNGRRRRATIKDKAVRLAHIERDAWGVVARDTANRARGLKHRIESRFEEDHPSDEKLEARVRAQMGRCVTNSRAIQVTSNDGHITLTGDVLAREVQELIHRVKHVRGVTSVENQLNVHESAENVPSLQGSGHNGHNSDAQRTWRPATALVMGVAGGALALYGVARKDAVGAALGAVGMGVLAKSGWDVEGKQLMSLAGVS
jgi:hypothetical protein